MTTGMVTGTAMTTDMVMIITTIMGTVRTTGMITITTMSTGTRTVR
ncbi:hypothetical protein [Vitiosangium sp. GDMCC 1.1324]|nr:hypothetical protein [Vitiosangium sp. GDMCC 1.1324]